LTSKISEKCHFLGKSFFDISYFTKIYQQNFFDYIYIYINISYKQFNPTLSDITSSKYNRPISLMLDISNNTNLKANRYENLYYDKLRNDSTTQYCGTFYFFERESDVILDLCTTAIFGSKIHALKILANIAQKIIPNKF